MKRILLVLPMMALAACGDDHNTPNGPINYPPQMPGEYQQQGQAPYYPQQGQQPYYPQQPAPVYYPQQQQQSGTSLGDIATGAAVGALLHRAFSGSTQQPAPAPEVRYIRTPPRTSIAPQMRTNTPIPVAKPTLVMPTRMLPTTSKPSMAMPSRMLPPTAPKSVFVMPSRTLPPVTKFRPVTGSSFRAQPSRRK